MDRSGGYGVYIFPFFSFVGVGIDGRIFWEGFPFLVLCCLYLARQAYVLCVFVYLVCYLGRRTCLCWSALDGLWEYGMFWHLQGGSLIILLAV